MTLLLRAFTILLLCNSWMVVASYTDKMEELSYKLPGKKQEIFRKIKQEGLTENLLEQMFKVNKKSAPKELYWVSHTIARIITELKTKTTGHGSVMYRLSTQQCEEQEEKLMTETLNFCTHFNLIASKEAFEGFKEVVIEHRDYIAACCVKKEVTHESVEKNLIPCFEVWGTKSEYKQHIIKLYTDEIY